MELRIQEHHRLLSQSVKFCDNMEGTILRKLQDYGRSQFMTASRHWQKAKSRFRYITDANTFLCNLSVTVAGVPAFLPRNAWHSEIFSFSNTIEFRDRVQRKQT